MREATKFILFTLFLTPLLFAQNPHPTAHNYPYDPVLQALQEELPAKPNESNASGSETASEESLSNQENSQSGRIDPRQYLSLKKIVFPMPQDYAQACLKLKTLDNPLHKTIRVQIDKSRQRMWVYLDNDYFGDWKVSTARRGYWTPNGTYRPYSLERMHYSRKYHNSPMPWSVFFKGGYAIHGTYSIRHLGHPASHGCVRVHPRNAKKLYQLIRRYGKQNTRIIIRG
ncbi:L,D-transpeptidase [Nitratifractor sp.]|uniref:L,D-transpeptidase n=1 Tax=Nitratifractor sp. TaxID=2268144 RepID=UPI0025E3BF79|nr:L,D-transpeptidase [Nitratifractor sp.]